LWHGELVLAIEQGVKLKRALHLRLREQHEFRVSIMACFLLLSQGGPVAANSGTLANKKQQHTEQPGRKRATYEFDSQNPSLRTLLQSTRHSLAAGSRGG
jgi:hypothetical protein